MTVNIGPVELLNTKTNPTEQSLKTVWRKSIVTCTEKLLAQFQRINKFLRVTQVKLNNIQEQYIFNENVVCLTNVCIFSGTPLLVKFKKGGGFYIGCVFCYWDL